MLIKKIAITAAAGALMLASAAGAFAHHHSGSSTISHSFNDYSKNVSVTNGATVSNTTVTVANTGLNFTGSNGGVNTANTSSSGETEDGGHNTVNGGAQYQGGASSAVTTGDAGAGSVVTNSVNTTTVSF